MTCGNNSLRGREFRGDLRRLASVLLRLGCFEKQVDMNLRRSARKRAKGTGINLDRFFLRSLRQSRGRLYLVCRKQRAEFLICFEHPSISKGKLPSVFSDARRESIEASSGTCMTVYVTAFTNENLLKLIEEEFPDLSPKSMKKTPRLGLGVRMLFTLPPFLQAIERVRCLADFQLSAGREFSLKDVIEAAPGHYPEWLGHTGLDAAALYGTIARECFKFGRSVYGTEIDHAIVSPEPSATISRIRSKTAPSGLRPLGTHDSRLEDSMTYNYRIIKEATRTGFVAGITTDTSALFREEVDDITSWPKARLRAEYEKLVPAHERNLIEQFYHPGIPHSILGPAENGTYELTFTQEELMRLVVKFWDSLLANKRLYEQMAAAMNGTPFTFEISLDEAYKNLTTEKELFFWLAESDRMGMRADLIAPNVGFRKREDYQGNLTELEDRVRRLAAAASHFGAILDFHSGSDKRLEVYRAISRATNGQLKLKMAGVFQLLYFETLAGFRRGTEERKLFERLWRYTLSYVKRQAREGDDTARHMLREAKVRTTSGRKKGPKDDLFRHYSFITVAAKNRLGRYIFRNALYKIAEKRKVAERYNRRVVELTIKVARALGLQGSESLLPLTQLERG
jgi:hypothetical protein